MWRRRFFWLNQLKKEALVDIVARLRIRPWIITSRLASRRLTWWWVRVLHWRREIVKWVRVRALISITLMLWILNQFSLKRICFLAQSNQLNQSFLDTLVTVESQTINKFHKKHLKDQLKTWKCTQPCKPSNKCCKVCNSNKIIVLLQLAEITWILWLKGLKNKWVLFYSHNWLNNP